MLIYQRVNHIPMTVIIGKKPYSIHFGRQRDPLQDLFEFVKGRNGAAAPCAAEEL